MQVKILGSAAGGGFPQWNCACWNCARLRAGTFRGSARTQAQIAVRATGRPWCLLNASPDLRSQILSDADFAPRESPRSSPIAAVVLTGADVDQITGLLHLREFQPLRIYATAPVLKILRENSIFRALEQTPNQAQWCVLAAETRLELQAPDGSGLGVAIVPLALGGASPAYERHAGHLSTHSQDAVVGLFVESRAGDTLHRIFCAPSLPRIEEEWLAEWDRCDAIMIDGTFWSDDELKRTRGEGKTAREMGHIPISGRDGTIEALAKLKRARKIFYHINNTNPILDEESTERAQATAAGWEIAYDGMELTL